MNSKTNNKTISYLTAEKMSLQAKIKRLKQPNYKQELEDVVKTLKIKIDFLKDKTK